MKTVILAGGHGTRLGNVTQSIPKPMVRVGGRPLLWHIMSIYARHGFNDFVVALGVKGHVIREYFLNLQAHHQDLTVNLANGSVEFHGNDARPDWRVTLVDTGENTLKGARLKRLANHLDDGPNMVTYGDGLTDADITEIISFHKKHGKTVTMTGVRPPSRFGEIEERDGQALSFEEKPQTSAGLINGGFMVFEPSLLDRLTEDPSCDLEPTTLLDLAHEGEVMVYRHPGRWACVDHERDLQHLNDLWRSDEAFWMSP